MRIITVAAEEVLCLQENNSNFWYHRLYDNKFSADIEEQKYSNQCVILYSSNSNETPHLTLLLIASCGGAMHLKAFLYKINVSFATRGYMIVVVYKEKCNFPMGPTALSPTELNTHMQQGLKTKQEMLQSSPKHSW